MYDPELPVNIYDLKLIYGVVIRKNTVDIVMTLTTPACPVAESLPVEAVEAVRALPWVEHASIELTFEPPWTPHMLEDDVRLAIGFL